jgi:cytochrome P450
MIPRYTGSTPSVLPIGGKEYTLPAHTYILLNFVTLHSWPRYWGSDSLDWQPDRWITKDNPVAPLSREELFQPAPGMFIPWSSGPRVCPGKKFAQVEFVAVIARLFRKHRVVPFVGAGETLETAKKQIWKSIADSKLEITLQMENPEKVRLVWEECS